MLVGSRVANHMEYGDDITLFPTDGGLGIEDTLVPLFSAPKDESTTQALNGMNPIGGSFCGGLSNDLQDMPTFINNTPTPLPVKSENNSAPAPVPIKSKPQLKRKQSQSSVTRGSGRKRRRSVAKSEDNIGFVQAIQPYPRDMSRTGFYYGKPQSFQQAMDPVNLQNRGVSGIPLQTTPIRQSSFVARDARAWRHQSVEFSVHRGCNPIASPRSRVIPSFLFPLRPTRPLYSTRGQSNPFPHRPLNPSPLSSLLPFFRILVSRLPPTPPPSRCRLSPMPTAWARVHFSRSAAATTCTPW